MEKLTIEQKDLQTEAGRKKVLKEIAKQLQTDSKICQLGNHELTSLDIPFNGSPEGLTILLENNELHFGYGAHREVSLISLGLLEKDSWTMVINPWLNSRMPQAEKIRMQKIIEDALVLLPDAVLVFEDDSSVDYNPNSSFPTGPQIYACKVSCPNEWKSKFEE